MSKATCSVCGDTFSSERYAKSHRTQVHENSSEREKPWQNRDLLRRLYVDELKSTTEIGDELGCTNVTICNWLKRFGIELRNGGKIPRRNLLNDLHRLREELGDVPTSMDVESHGEYSVPAYQSEFGSWNNALREAGYELHCRIDIPKDELIGAIQELAEALGRAPTQLEMTAQGRYSYLPCKNRFGSWVAAVEAAGLTPVRRLDATEDELLAEIQRLADDLGSRPSAKDMMAVGEFSYEIYVKKFGSWDAAIGAAGFEPYAHYTGEDHPLYKGGEFSYGDGWNEEKKRFVRERDGRVCQHPGCDIDEPTHIDIFGRKHPVHHIAPARAFDDDERRNDPENLITLCSYHHPVWERMAPLRPIAE